ncbi:CheY-like chemotaxis protein/DNA-binding CsgD family transcriptional regulator [Paraburkholderia sp. WC7.3g]|uniref:response regulator n=1 Tax=Paraburkholderia sp. WC7.3g TaxID=2991070 RepID=UPI003D211BA4
MLRPDPLRDVVLIVDDAPENLSILHSLLDKSGYTVLVATDGAGALDRARRLPPDLILLDALMPGIDGFETCRRLKEDLQTRPIPVIFMTGLAETEHVLQGFQAGGVDYITKPIRPAEVMVRIASHLRNSRLVVQTRAAMDAAGQAVVAVGPSGEVLWLTPLAQSRLRGSLDAQGRLPAALCSWLQDALRAPEVKPFELQTAREQLIVSRPRRGAHGEELLVIQCKPGSPGPAALMQAFRLTPREADVLYWVAVGKTNRDIADILGMSPRTANKHLEHVFEKLGVETRTTAARMALNLVTPQTTQ